MQVSLCRPLVDAISVFCVHLEETLKLVYFVAMGLVLGERLTGSDDVTSWRLANLLE